MVEPPRGDRQTHERSPDANRYDVVAASAERGDRFGLFDLLVWGAAGTVALLFTALVGEIVWSGWEGLSWEFLTAAPRQAGRAGGIGPILVSTGLILAVCLAACVPIGVGTAVLLSELPRREGRFTRMVRRGLDVLAGVPSIVFGLFGNAFFCRYLGMGFSILAGGLTLACMVLPFFIRSTEEALRSVPSPYRLGAAALGMSQTSTLLRVVIPVALPGMGIGLILAIGRALAETAALIYTSGYVDRLPESFSDSGRSLSVHIYDLAMNVPGGNQNAYASAVVLMGILLVIHQLAVWGARTALRTKFLGRPGAP